MAYQSQHTGNEIDSGITNIQQIFDLIYPIGSYYMSSDSANPSTKFGGTWEQIKDRMIMAAGSSYAVGAIGGSKDHVHATAGHALTIDETPAHTHTKGTMNITGELNYNQKYSGNIFDSGGLVGAFTSKNTSEQDYYVNGRSTGSGWPENVIFDASRTWTGETSSVGGAQATPMEILAVALIYLHIQLHIFGGGLVNNRNKGRYTIKYIVPYCFILKYFCFITQCFF